MDNGPPEFTVMERTSGPFYFADVQYGWLIRTFVGETEAIARRKAEAWIAGELERYYKSKAAVEARRKGRKLGAIKAATEVPKP